MSTKRLESHDNKRYPTNFSFNFKKNIFFERIEEILRDASIVVYLNLLKKKNEEKFFTNISYGRLKGFLNQFA